MIIAGTLLLSPHEPIGRCDSRTYRRGGDRAVVGADRPRRHRNATRHGPWGRTDRGRRHDRGRRRDVPAQAETVVALGGLGLGLVLRGFVGLRRVINRGENPEPGKDVTESLTPRPELARP